MKTKLFIPDKLRVGFQARQDTFTGKLAYVIYYDEKNKIRKETSWNSWCNEKEGVLEIENKPQSGYIFNKGVQRDGHWGSGRSVIRIYDPRDFEFEISVDNLIGLLMHSDVSKRDIVEECIFAWNGPELVLLPVNSTEYQESLVYTAKQSMKVSTKDLVPGRQYTKKKNDSVVTYLGFYPWHTWEQKTANGNEVTSFQKFKGKKHLFLQNGTLSPHTVSTLSGEVGPDIVENFAFLVDDYFASDSSSFAVSSRIKHGTVDTNVEECLSLCKDVDGKVEVLRVWWSWGYKDHNRAQMAIRYYTIDLDSNEHANMHTEYSSCYHRLSFQAHDQHSKTKVAILRQQLKSLSERQPNNELSKQQIYDVFIEQGYGHLMLTLENGNETHHKLGY